MLLVVGTLFVSSVSLAQQRAVDVGDYCKLFAAADEYDGKRVTVYGIYSYGFDWT
jgi:hypothetical protein